MVSDAGLTDLANAPIGQVENHVAEAVSAASPTGGAQTSSFLAFILYQIIAIVFFGRSLLGHLGSLIAGQSSDPGYYIWCFVWWPYAVAHHLNPLVTRFIWAPDGFNVAWSTSIPLLSFAAWPLTIYCGPVVAFNLINLVLPALAAWSGFLLMRRMVVHYVPALLGGYLFGFSPFMAASQSAGHIVFTAAAALVPATLGLVLKRLAGEYSAARFGALLALILLGQFLISIEFFATMILLGLLGLGIAFALWPERRRQFVSLALSAAVALSAVTALLSPYLYYMLHASGPGLHPVWSGTAQADLLEFVIPTRVMMLGQLPVLRDIASHYSYNAYTWDSGAYAGLPMLVIAAVFLKSRWHRPSSKLSAILIATIVMAMLGRHLRIGGHRAIKLPWLLIGKLPFLNSAVPARFALYFHLLLAIIVAIWLAESRRSFAIKSLGVGLIVAALLPNPNGSFWVRPLELPEFFASGDVRQQLQEHETVITLPYGSGVPMIWQAEDGMYFSMAEALTGPVPRSFEAWPIVNALKHDLRIPIEDQQLRAFLVAHDVKTVLIDVRYPQAGFWRLMLESAGAKIQDSQGVIVARFPSRRPTTIPDELPARGGNSP
jgi:hypothetical protein